MLRLQCTAVIYNDKSLSPHGIRASLPGSNVLNSCSRHTIAIRSIILMRVIDTAARRPYMVMIIEIQCFHPGLEGFQPSA